MRSTLSPLVFVALLAGGPAVAAPAAAPVPLVAVLSGSPTAGDPDGSGRAELTLDTARLRLCYALAATGIAPASAASLNRGPATDTGRPVVRLVAPRDGESRNCVELTPYDANEILRHPENYYVSIRNAEHPAGALRGQLQR